MTGPVERQGEALREALIEKLHGRHAAPHGFDSKPSECVTCAEDADMALSVFRSPVALIEAGSLVNVEAERVLSRADWKLLRSFLAEVMRSG